MEIFIITFVVFLIIILIMSLGVMLMNKNIKGSCGGLNAISGTDKCSVCNKSYKTTVFAMFYIHSKQHTRGFKPVKFDAGACRPELFAQIASKTRLGARRTRFWRGLGPSWAALGRHLAGFGVRLGGSSALFSAS